MPCDIVIIAAEAVHIPDGTLAPDQVADYCKRYEQDIAAAGGLDLQVGTGKEQESK
jgi:glucosamine-6-phosphate deaminase